MPIKRDNPKTRWCFTLNNYDDESIQLLQTQLTADNCTYAVVGKEVGESGTPHLQGYVHLKKKIRFSSIKTLLPNGCHIEAARGTDQQNETYCSKDGSIVLQVGTPTKGTSERGGGSKRINTAVEMAEKLASGVPQTELLQDREYAAAYLLHWKNIQVLTNSYKQAQVIERLRREFATTRWYTWQYLLIRSLTHHVPDPRRVTWFMDKDGNTGKTFLSRYLVTHHDAVRFENGKSTDIKHAYGGNKIVIFDFSRSQQEHINYEVIESIKNGIVFSPKYESDMKVFDPPHLVCFANFAPDYSKMSDDRWDVRELTEQDKKYWGEDRDCDTDVEME